VYGDKTHAGEGDGGGAGCFLISSNAPSEATASAFTSPITPIVRWFVQKQLKTQDTIPIKSLSSSKVAGRFSQMPLISASVKI